MIDIYINSQNILRGMSGPYRPRGRTARPEASSRKGQFYDSPIEPVYKTTLGELTVLDFKRKLNTLDLETKFSAVKEKPSCMRFSRKSCACGGKIHMNGDGRAVCTNPQCSTVFNDGGNIEGMLKVTNHYSDGRTVEVVNARRDRETVSEDHPWLTKHFMKRISH